MKAGDLRDTNLRRFLNNKRKVKPLTGVKGTKKGEN